MNFKQKVFKTELPDRLNFLNLNTNKITNSD